MYQWLVFAHLVGLVVFAMCHGVAVFSAFRIRGLRDTAAVRDQLDLREPVEPAHVHRPAAARAWAASARPSSANLWGAAWLTWSCVVLIAVIVGDVRRRRRATTTRCATSLTAKDGAAPAEGEALAPALDSPPRDPCSRSVAAAS